MSYKEGKGLCMFSYAGSMTDKLKLENLHHFIQSIMIIKRDTNADKWRFLLHPPQYLFYSPLQHDHSPRIVHSQQSSACRTHCLDTLIPVKYGMARWSETPCQIWRDIKLFNNKISCYRQRRKGKNCLQKMTVSRISSEQMLVFLH